MITFDGLMKIEEFLEMLSKFIPHSISVSLTGGQKSSGVGGFMSYIKNKINPFGGSAGSTESSKLSSSAGKSNWI